MHKTLSFKYDLLSYVSCSVISASATHYSTLLSPVKCKSHWPEMLTGYQSKTDTHACVLTYICHAHLQMPYTAFIFWMTKKAL